MSISYKHFKELNKDNKENNMPHCKITHVRLKDSMCKILTDGAECEASYNIMNLIMFVSWGTIGYIKNPSAIQNWSNWAEKFKLS